MRGVTVIFGASNFGKIVYNEIKNTEHVIGFCDNDSTKWNSLLFDLPIFSVNDLIQLYKKQQIKIIIASTFHIEIIHQLSLLGIQSVYVSFLSNNFDPLKSKASTKTIIKKYNISDFSNLKIVENRIGLIVRNHSGSNTFALWKEMPKYIKENFDVILIYDYEDRIENYKKMFSCKILVTTHSNNLGYFDNNDKDRIYIQLWHGPPMKGVGRLDKSIPKEKKNSHIKWQKFDKITSYSPFYTTLLSACFIGDNKKFEITGAPRNDYLFTSNGRKQLEQLIPIDVTNKKIVYYMPTFRFNKYLSNISGNKTWTNIFGFEKFNFKDFSYFLDENDIVLVLKMHPYEEEYVKNLLKDYETNNIFLYVEDMKKGIDFYETLNACDLLITDYSSVFYDFLLLDRPIIFTPVDIKEYEKNAGFLYGPYELWTPGDKAYTQCELQKYIISNLMNINRHKIERERIRKIFHNFVDYHATDRVWKLIEHTYSSKKK